MAAKVSFVKINWASEFRYGHSCTISTLSCVEFQGSEIILIIKSSFKQPNRALGSVPNLGSARCVYCIRDIPSLQDEQILDLG